MTIEDQEEKVTLTFQERLYFSWYAENICSQNILKPKRLDESEMEWGALLRKMALASRSKPKPQLQPQPQHEESMSMGDCN
jgi:hypothetical protein